MRRMLKSKLHRARVTAVNLDYEGSIAIDPVLLGAANILPYEEVQVLNINNGARFETYALEGDRGEVMVNGAAARLVAPGDIVIILSYVSLTEEEAQHHQPHIVKVDERNRSLEPASF